VDECHLCADSFVWIKSCHTFKKVYLQLIKSMGMLLHRDASELREGWLKVGQLQSIRPIIFMRGSQYLEYFEDLVDFTISHEKRALLSHLRENATGGPNVNSKRVMLLREQDFGAPVPQSNDLVSITLNRKAKGSGQTEVCQLDSLSIFTDKQVLGLEISVENSV